MPFSITLCDSTNGSHQSQVFKSPSGLKSGDINLLARGPNEDSRLYAPPANNVNTDPQPARCAPALEGLLPVMAVSFPHGVRLSGILPAARRAAAPPRSRGKQHMTCMAATQQN
ncbi:hypothetical protein EYF80_041261 [Liparis tanakae]|uniref:Uncharacterized protein n=1 Tax=Liparis tanakae TaxID=230148 RepID=A0A4Z2G4L9_9TELE|nr:hypothetical protein EYF80_041261 [Liparis tanakae]